MNPLDELSKLTSMFPTPKPLFAAVDYIASSTAPEPYRTLLVHDHHMTVTMEAHHGGPVAVEVLAERRIGDVYCRKIVLRRTEDGGRDAGRVVQFGLVRFDLGYVIPEVREEILAGQTPLGRVLINYNVLRQVDFGAILRFEAGPELAELLPIDEGQRTFGRLATIFCNNRPAVDLLEVAAPIDGEAVDEAAAAVEVEEGTALHVRESD